MATYSETAAERVGVPGGYGECYGCSYGQTVDQITDSAVVLRIAKPATSESAVFTDAAFPSLITNRTATEVARGNDTAIPVRVIPLTVEETAEFADTATPLVRTVLTESASFGDTASIQVTTTGLLTEHFRARDSLIAVKVLVATETADFVDAATAVRYVPVTAAESAEFNDLLVSPVRNGVVLAAETAVFSDTATLLLTSNATAQEEAFITDHVYLNDEDGGYVWTALTSTWAMSRYVGTPFTSMLDDFAATNTALLVRDGGYADADVLTADSDLMSQDLKRVRSLHMYGEHAVPLSVTVTADVKGLRETHSYTQMARDASDVRAVRCTFGRGYKSQCYQIGAQSQGYARMRAWVPLVDSTRRRI